MTPNPDDRSPSPRHGLLLGAAVFLFALVIRLVGIGWGLPNDEHWQSLHPDEPIVWIYSQQVNPAQFDFDPGFYNYGTLYLSMLRVATDATQAYGGGPKDRSEKEMWMAIGRYHLAGRAMSAVAGAATAWVVVALLWRRAGLLGAGLGGLALALAPGHTVHSRFQTVDVLSALFVALALLLAVRMVEQEGEPKRWLGIDRYAIGAGAMAGLAAGTKYAGVLVLLGVFVAVGLATRGRDGAKPALTMLTALGATGMTFFLTTPGALTHLSTFLRDFRYEMAHTATGHGLVFAGTTSGFVYHLANLSSGMTVLVALAGLIGLGWAAGRREPWALIGLAFAVAYYVLIGRAEVKFFRYVIPLLPVLALGFGWLVSVAHREMGMRGKLLVGFLVIALGGALSSTVRSIHFMTTIDPRVEAARYIREQAPKGTVGLVSDPWYWSATLYPQVALPRSTPFALRDQLMRQAGPPRVLRYIPAQPEERFDWDTRLLDENPDFVVYSSFESADLNRIRRLNLPGFQLQVERFNAFMARLEREYEPVRIFGPGGPTIHDLMYVYPSVAVWKRKDTPTTSTGSSTTSASSGEPASTR